MEKCIFRVSHLVTLIEIVVFHVQMIPRCSSLPPPRVLGSARVVHVDRDLSPSPVHPSSRHPIREWASLSAPKTGNLKMLMKYENWISKNASYDCP